MILKGYLQEAIELYQLLLTKEDFLASLETTIHEVAYCLRHNHKVLVAGNGGSASDAQHFAGEFIGRYKKERKAHPVISLTADTSVLTAWSNDYTYETVFARQIEALGNKGDMFIGISTSGNSKNIIEGISKAKELGLKTICWLGNEGGKAREIADFSIVVPSHNTPRIQEVHHLILHIITEEVENILHQD